jgi:hypothetical protein
MGIGAIIAAFVALLIIVSWVTKRKKSSSSRTLKLPDKMIVLKSPPIGSDGAPTWTEELEIATERFGSEFRAAAMYETAPGQTLGILLARAVYKTEARPYIGSAVLVQRQDDSFRSKVYVTAPAATTGLYSYPKYDYAYFGPISKEDAKDIPHLIRLLCEKSHSEIVAKMVSDRSNEQVETVAIPNDARPPSHGVEDWKVREDRDEVGMSRLYTFANTPAPGRTTLLKLECSVSRQLNGVVRTYIGIDIQPYLYLIPDRRPFSEELTKPPFLVYLFSCSSGRGTEADPLARGGVFNTLGCSIKDRPDAASLGIYNEGDARAWIKTMSYDADLTLSFLSDKFMPLLKLTLSNDSSFRRLYREILGKV